MWVCGGSFGRAEVVPVGLKEKQCTVSFGGQFFATTKDYFTWMRYLACSNSLDYFEAACEAKPYLHKNVFFQSF